MNKLVPALFLAIVSGAGACATAAQSPEPQPPRQQQQAPAGASVNQDARIQKEFLDRVNKYLELRNSEEGKLPRLGGNASPEEIAKHQAGLLKALQRARRGAKQGDVFTPETRALIRRLVAGTTAKPGSSTREAIHDENPGKIAITVNGPYPTSAPLPTVPPQVLASLPRLPDEQIEFRFLGPRLILLDVKANMVVDFMDRAL